MNPPILFLLACIPIRLLLCYVSYRLPLVHLPVLGIVLLAIGLSFIWLFFTDMRLSAPEAGGYTWWHNLRLIHGMLYLTAAVYAFRKQRIVWIPLFLDVLFGLNAFVRYRLPYFGLQRVELV